MAKIKSTSIINNISVTSCKFEANIRIMQHFFHCRSDQLKSQPSPYSARKTTSRSQSISSEKSDDSSKCRSNPSTPKRTSKSKGVFKKLVAGSKPRSVTETSVSNMDLGGMCIFLSSIL